MDANEPGLFDLPECKPPVRPERPLRGRNRETWARTATAEVTIIDAAALHEAAARAQRNAVTIGLRDGTEAQAIETRPADVKPANDALDALGWLIWPPEGMEGPLEAGAFQIRLVDSEVVA